jgi:D-amino-acid dehydrogenase
MQNVIVIGGGVVGAAAAWYLQEAGKRVTIVDKKNFGAACSRGNCGFVCPSHVLPLTTPGAFKMAAASLFQKNSPFRVKPRLSLSLMKWFYRFARRCNTRDMLAAGYEIQALLNSSRTLYTHWVEQDKIACEWETKGLMFVFKSHKAFAHYAEVNDLLKEQFQQPAKALAGVDLSDYEPSLKPGLAGAWLYEQDAHLRPDVLMASLRKKIIERGGIIQENCDVQEIVSEGGKAVKLRTSQGEFTADAFVVATGATTPFLNETLGCNIPIQPGKGYSLTMPRPRRCPITPMIFEEHRVAVTPMQTGYRIGSTMEFSGYDESLPPARLQYLKDAAAIYLKDPEATPVEETWFGWRPMTWDSKPIIDFSPRYNNVLIAAGHNMLGLSMAPATGKLVAELLTNQQPHIPVEPFSLKRF